MRLKILFSLALFSLFAFPAYAEVQSSTRFENYVIEGNSVEELRSAMDRYARSSGGHYASTKWDIRWSERWAAKNGACVLTHFNVTLAVVFKMPEWRGAETADPLLRDKWLRFRNALQLHEDGHKDMGVQAARKIDGILKNFGPVSSCDSMAAAVNRAGEAVLAEYQQKEIQYDAETRHGIFQGAQF